MPLAAKMDAVAVAEFKPLLLRALGQTYAAIPPTALSESPYREWIAAHAEAPYWSEVMAGGQGSDR